MENQNYNIENQNYNIENQNSNMKNQNSNIENQNYNIKEKKYRYINDFDTKKYHILSYEKHLFGFVLYILIFVFLLPNIMSQLKLFNLLEVYLPNVDLFATVLSYYEGPGSIWRLLYLPTPTTLTTFIYQTVINYIALLGLTYIISRETKLTKSVYKGWSLGFIMLLLTYLLPNQLISHLMSLFDHKINKYNYDDNKIFCNECKKIYVLIFGICIVILIIILEKIILKKCKNSLISLSKIILK